MLFFSALTVLNSTGRRLYSKVKVSRLVDFVQKEWLKFSRFRRVALWCLVVVRA
jgi:hypothetical protein